jgi:hypothetical protein
MERPVATEATERDDAATEVPDAARETAPVEPTSFEARSNLGWAGGKA